jgi:hypothetical protein
MRRATQGADHSEIGIDLASLAALYHRQGDLARAERTYRDALGAIRRTLGAMHPAGLAAAESLAVIERGRRR